MEPTAQQMLQMSEAEFDALPFGVIRLDAEGKVLAYNAAESALARRKKEQVIGRNFFTEVAPCTNTDAFAGRFHALCAAAVADSQTFDYPFQFPWGVRHVRIRLLFDKVRNAWVFVTVL